MFVLIPSKVFVLLSIIFFNQNISLNKRPMGHITHMRNQFKSMNMLESMINSIYIIKLVQKFRRRTFLNLWMDSCNFVIISHCKKVRHFHLIKLKSSLPRDAFSQVWLILVLWNIFFKFSLFVKSLRQQQQQWLRQTNCDHKSSLEPWAQMSSKGFVKAFSSDLAQARYVGWRLWELHAILTLSGELHVFIYPIKIDSHTLSTYLMHTEELLI